VGRHLRSVVGLALLTLSLLLGLYGLFAVLYRGDSGGNGDTYVTFGGHQVDAQLAGAVALLVSLIAILVAWTILRRGRRERSSS
jgi:predicted Co/Zn/Cd cation transporter (cation efflux family)